MAPKKPSPRPIPATWPTLPLEDTLNNNEWYRVKATLNIMFVATNKAVAVKDEEAKLNKPVPRMVSMDVMINANFRFLVMSAQAPNTGEINPDSSTDPPAAIPHHKSTWALFCKTTLL